MERLTIRNSDGVAFWVTNKGAMGGYRYDNDKKDNKRLDRLAAYEDTGWEPDEVAALVSNEGQI